MDLVRTDSYGYVTLIYAEGSTLFDETVEISQAYAKKEGVEHPFTHTFMPRALGLFQILQKLGKPPAATKYLYLVAQAYSPLKPGAFAYDEYTPARVFFAGQAPEKVEWRVWRFPIDQIPGVMNSRSNDNGDVIKAPKPIHEGVRNRTEKTATPATCDGAEDAPADATKAQAPRARLVYPSKAHNFDADESQRLDKFAHWMTDRWLELNEAMRSYYTTGTFTEDVHVTDMKITGKTPVKLQTDEITVVPTVWDVVTLLVSVCAVFYPLVGIVKWIGIGLFWQVAFFAVVASAVSAAGYLGGLL
jgi:hypothetical protein